MKMSKRIKDVRYLFTLFSLLFLAGMVLIGAILNIIAYISWLCCSALSTFEPSKVFSSDVINISLGAAGIGATVITAAKALPGSPELTDEEDRMYDSSLNQKNKTEDKGV